MGILNGDNSNLANTSHIKGYDNSMKKLEETTNMVKEHAKEIIEKQKKRDERVSIIHSNMYNFSFYCAFFILAVKLIQIFCVKSKVTYKKLI